MIENTASITAKLCALARAYHSNNERNKIFDDYLAFDLLGREEYERIGQLVDQDYRMDAINPHYDFKSSRIKDKMERFLAPIPLSRAAYAENELAKYAKTQEHFQYVILGAGLDTFAFRNENPNIEIFEIDHPDTQRYKLERIHALEWNIPTNVHYVSVDFSKDDMIANLKAAGFDPSVPSFFAFLGVTYYLTLPIFEKSLQAISTVAAEGSKLIFDYPDETTFTDMTSDRVRKLSEMTEQLGETMVHGYSYEEINNALARYNFNISLHESPDTIQKAFFAGRSEEEKAYENIHFITATKYRSKKAA